MKTINNLFILTTTCLLLAACGTTEQPTPQKPAVAGRKAEPAEEPDRDDGSTPPRRGMTREQVKAKYGRPVSVSINSNGEVWSYAFNNFDGRAFIPYYGAWVQGTKKRNSSVIFFDHNGRVRDFTWNEVDPMGASVWR